VGAAAVSARSPLSLAERRIGRGARGLAFDELGGPTVAVCGLTGGAGTSTLALQLARHAGARSAAPILVTESEPSRAGLAVLTGHATPRPLVALAQEVAGHRTPRETFAELFAGLRLIASTPQPAGRVAPEAIGELLAQAREAHGLVIVDCGTRWCPDSPVLAAASHILWTIPATPTGLAAARALLGADVAPRVGRWREVLAATAILPRPHVSVRALRRLARTRCEQLLLIAYDETLARGEPDASESTTRALEGMSPILRRRS
jgi:hypothetical protein